MQRCSCTVWAFQYQGKSCSTENCNTATTMLNFYEGLCNTCMGSEVLLRHWTEVPPNLAKSCFSVTEVDVIVTVIIIIISCHLELQAQFRLGSVLVSHWRVEPFSHWLQCLSVQFCGLLSLTGINHWPLVMQCLSCTWNFYANPWQQVKNHRRTTLECCYMQRSQAYFLLTDMLSLSLNFKCLCSFFSAPDKTFLPVYLFCLLISLLME